MQRCPLPLRCVRAANITCVLQPLSSRASLPTLSLPAGKKSRSACPTSRALAPHGRRRRRRRRRLPRLPSRPARCARRKDELRSPKPIARAPTLTRACARAPVSHAFAYGHTGGPPALLSLPSVVRRGCLAISVNEAHAVLRAARAGIGGHGLDTAAAAGGATAHAAAGALPPLLLLRHAEPRHPPRYADQHKRRTACV